MKRYQRHSSYIFSRMLLIYMLLEIAYFILASVFAKLHEPIFWNWLFLTIPVIALLAFFSLVHAVFTPGTSKLAARYAAQMSLIVFAVASATFAILLGSL